MNYHVRVMLCGGTDPLIVDLGRPPYSFKPAATRQFAKKPDRQNGNAVLMPDGRVFVRGGKK